MNRCDDGKSCFENCELLLSGDCPFFCLYTFKEEDVD